MLFRSDVVGREDADPVCPEQGDEMHVLEHGVGRALEPVLAAPHLRRDQRDEEIPSAKGSAELPAPFDVLVQGLALELNQDVDGEDPAVDQVRQGEVDDAVLGGEIDGGLGLQRDGNQVL